MAVTAEEKAQLKERRVWKAFCDRRKALHLEEGYSASNAQAQALQEFLSDDPGVEYKLDPAPKAKKANKADKGSSGDVDIDGLPRKSRPTELIQWVAGNLVGDVDLDSCPGKDAYALLTDCQANAGFRLDFWKSMYTKTLPTRAQLGDEDEEFEMDGTMALDVLNKISKIADRARGVDQPTVGGS